MMPQYLILPELIPHLLTFPLQSLLFGHVPISVLALGIPFFDSLVRPLLRLRRGRGLAGLESGGRIRGSQRRGNDGGTTQFFLLGDALFDELFERRRIFGGLLQHVPVGFVVFPGLVFEGGIALLLLFGLLGIAAVVVLVAAIQDVEEIRLRRRSGVAARSDGIIGKCRWMK